MTISGYLLHARAQGAPDFDGGLLPMTAPTTAVGANSTGSAAVALGFAFPFCGGSYTSVTASARGWVSFSGTAPSSNNADLFASDSRVLLAAWWDAMTTAEATGYVRHETQGAAPWRRCVIDWLCYASDAQTAADHDTLSWQVVMHESGVVELRYGTHTATPGATPITATASIGARQGTTGWRDMAALEADHALGGSSTTTTTNIGLAAWPGPEGGEGITGTNYRFEPNVPVPSYLDPLDGAALHGRNDPAGEPLVRMGRNANFVLATHSPPHVAAAPHTDEAVSHTFIIPVSPSVDGRAYAMDVATYTTDGSTAGIDLDVYEDLAGAVSQPGTAGHWGTASSYAHTPHGADSSEWWDNDEVLLDHRTRLLKVVFTDGDAAGVLPLFFGLRPLELAALDPSPPSGALPFALGQLVHEGHGAVHKEILNRMASSVAARARDLEQVAFCFLQPTVSKTSWAHSAKAPSHRIGVFAPVLTGQAGATLAVRLYAKSTGVGSTVVVGEEGNEAVTLAVTNGAWGLVTGTLRVQRERPTVYAHARPAAGTTVEVLALVGAWRPGRSS